MPITIIYASHMYGQLPVNKIAWMNIKAKGNFLEARGKLTFVIMTNENNSKFPNSKSFLCLQYLAKLDFRYCLFYYYHLLSI